MNEKVDMLNKLFAINDGLNRKFSDGDEPFKIITRLLEECGELAREVNHFEGSGVKREKHGEPDKARLIKEIRQTLCCVLQIAQYYQVEDELKASIDTYYQILQEEGLIK